MTCPRHCDCSHPGECLFATLAPERPSFAMWIVGAVVLAVAILAVLLI